MLSDISKIFEKINCLCVIINIWWNFSNIPMDGQLPDVDLTGLSRNQRFGGCFPTAYIGRRPTISDTRDFSFSHSLILSVMLVRESRLIVGVQLERISWAAGCI